MIPDCCGSAMSTRMDLGRFVEVICNKCGDIIYVKKLSQTLPQLIDD